jgi:predicted lipoprotein with Yx(FWY)xxD motif
MARITLGPCPSRRVVAAVVPLARRRRRPRAAPRATVDVSKSSLGSILVNSNGRTLYLFTADVGRQSACTSACGTKWPPFLATGKPSAGAGLTASKLATIARSDGTRQITYNGHPLYLFVKDQKPGDVKGQGVIAFGAAWFALSLSGNQVSATAPDSTSRGSSGGGDTPRRLANHGPVVNRAAVFAAARFQRLAGAVHPRANPRATQPPCCPASS